MGYQDNELGIRLTGMTERRHSGLEILPTIVMDQAHQGLGIVPTIVTGHHRRLSATQPISAMGGHANE
jgi:hypothetical protein